VTKNDPDAIALDHRFESLEDDGSTVTVRFSNPRQPARPRP